MKLLKISFDHLRMFENGLFEMDFYASDKVPAGDESVARLAGRIYSNNVVGLAGINASGKTTALALIELAGRIVEGSPLLGGSLPTTIASCFDGDATFRCLACEGQTCFLIESEIRRDGDGDLGSGEAPLVFGDELVYRLPISKLRRSYLASWDALKAASQLRYRRAELPDSWLAFASPEASISAAAIAKEAGVRRRVPMLRDTGFALRRDFAGLDTVLRVFDPSIEHLEVAADGKAFSTKFKGCDPMVLSESGLGEVLSSGTVRGMALIGRAISTLRCGGYLLVDEIENHLNRQLVNVVLDLFVSVETNPLGATLVFTTHYPQLLDSIHRKDNVYFLASTYGNGSRVVKYCTQVKRIENKKSEVFVSNFVKGTAPRYLDVRSLKELIAGEVASDER